MNMERRLPTVDLEKVAESLINRIPKEYGKYLSCDAGWYSILKELDAKLSYIDKDYKIYQVKEKFGLLRFYYGTEKIGLEKSMMDDFVGAAELESGRVCESCGNGQGRNKVLTDHTVTLRSHGRVKTLCDSCDTALFGN